MVDTDVVAAALLGEADRGAASARLLAAADELLAPSHWKAELANVVWKATLLGRLAAERIAEVLAAAGALGITSVDVSRLWEGAVGRATRFRHPVCDTLFLELSEREGLFLASWDRPLRELAPNQVRTPTALLRSKAPLRP